VYISSVIKLPKDQKVYVIGMSGIEEELREEGIAFIGGTVGDSSKHGPSLINLIGSRGLYSRAVLVGQLYS